MLIRKYSIEDQNLLFQLIQSEGDEWKDYWKNPDKYSKTLNNSIVYVCLDGDTICGYIRCKDDDGYGIYILDLLVHKNYRGKSYGKELMKAICNLYPNDDVYVTSDVDPYYIKQGCIKEGTIFKVIL